MKAGHSACEVAPFPRVRELSLDLLRLGQRKLMIHALAEADVTAVRRCIREHRTQTGEAWSLTAFVVACVARAVAENRHMHAYRRGRSQLVMFEDVDVNTMVERTVDGQRMGTPHIIRAADKKTFPQIHAEIRAAQAAPVEQLAGMEFFRWVPLLARLPTPVRMAGWRVLMASPERVKRFAGTVGVTAVGMFGPGLGWGLTIPLLTLNVVVGGIAERLVPVEGKVEPRESLCLTISVDHEIVDGAPAARFVSRLRELIESGAGLVDLSLGARADNE